MTRRRTKRGAITDEDRALWEKVVAQTDRLKPVVAVLAQPPASPIRIRTDPPEPWLEPFKVGERVVTSTSRALPVISGLSATTSPNMDKRNFDRLKKGKLAVDGKIDLHGLTLAQAHPRLNGFIRDAYSDGKRLLLVITGKGKPTLDQSLMVERRGVLRHQVPQWLAMAPLAPLILQVTQATQKHGGGGAFYVYLRRQR